MGKASRCKRKSRSAQPGDVHERIQIEAQKRPNSPEAIMSEFLLEEAGPDSALGGLIEAAQDAVNKATPAKFMYEGRPYWLRISVGMAMLEVFDHPANSKPLARKFTGSMDKFGHEPGH